jgi:4'-phosphopantetheinyl transferase
VVRERLIRMDPDLDWPVPPPRFWLRDGAAHVWAWQLRCADRTLKEYTALLSPEERIRMQGFAFDELRRGFAICHARVRILLGRYLGLHPASIQFVQGEFGKPKLAPHLLSSGLLFNLSHTHRLALLAVTRELEVGVDVEELRPIEAGIAERFFSPKEREDLRSLAGSQWIEGFFHCWTRKEAVLKAEGVGIGVSLEAFDVSLLPGDRAFLREFRPASGLTTHWNIVELRPAPGFIGALATEAALGEIGCYRFLE